MFEVDRPNRIYESLFSINSLSDIVKDKIVVEAALSFARSCWFPFVQSLMHGWLSRCRVRFDAEDRRSVLSAGSL
jgi:hypothetical protein